MHPRRRNRPPRCGLRRTGHRGQIRSTQLRESREPRAESREPRAESREPRAESREPRAESREPRAESREPRAESREPRAESREPRAESREPRAESREPRAESREPRAESREPRAESREPRAESREPRAESREPRAGEPRAESREPRAEIIPTAAALHASAEPMQGPPHSPLACPGEFPSASDDCPVSRGTSRRRRRCTALARVLAWLFAGLVWSLMTPGQAQAQTETEPVWSTTMTVGETTVSEGLGYSIDREKALAGRWPRTRSATAIPL